MKNYIITNKYFNILNDNIAKNVYDLANLAEELNDIIVMGDLRESAPFDIVKNRIFSIEQEQKTFYAIKNKISKVSDDSEEVGIGTITQLENYPKLIAITINENYISDDTIYISYDTTFIKEQFLGRSVGNTVVLNQSNYIIVKISNL